MLTPAGKLTEPNSLALTVAVLGIFSPLSFVAAISTVKSPVPKLVTVDSTPLAVFCGCPMAKSGSATVSIQLLKSSPTSLRSAPAEIWLSRKLEQRDNRQRGRGCEVQRDYWL